MSSITRPPHRCLHRFLTERSYRGLGDWRGGGLSDNYSTTSNLLETVPSQVARGVAKRIARPVRTNDVDVRPTTSCRPIARLASQVCPARCHAVRVPRGLSEKWRISSLPIQGRVAQR
jgi:hypothetical protein